MARSYRVSRAKAANKALREQAKAAAIPVHQMREKNTSTAHAPILRRNPGRMDGTKWNGDAFICPVRVDDGANDLEPHLDDDDYSDTDHEPAPRKMVISLMDIAKPAKEKRRPWQSFEMVRLKEVLVLEDDDEEWELLDGLG